MQEIYWGKCLWNTEGRGSRGRLQDSQIMVQVWHTGKEREEERGLGRKHLRLQCISEEISATPCGAGVNIAHLKCPMLGRSGPAPVPLLYWIISWEQHGESMVLAWLLWQLETPPRKFFLESRSEWHTSLADKMTSELLCKSDSKCQSADARES